MNKILKEDFELILSSYGVEFEKLHNAKILITGAYGMITSYLTEFLAYIAKDFNIELYLQCRNEKKAMHVFRQHVEEDFFHILTFDFERGEIPNIDIDYIIHAASPASTKAFVETPVDVISPNVIGTWNLLQYAKKKKVKKFLLCSSNSIYGEGGIEKTVLTEKDYGIVDPLNERSSYIESKRIAEQMCVAFSKQYEVKTSIIRICHTYGPTFDIENDSRIIPRVIKQILNGEDVVIYRDPNSVIQYTYIADMISAIMLVCLNGEVGVAYNSGGNEIVKMDDVITWMVNAESSIKSKLIEKEIDGNYNFSKGKGVNFVKLDNSKLRELGWKQIFNNEEGFSRTVKAYFNKC